MHVVVTGASTGIGEALARRFARDGHTLTLVARNKHALDQLAASLGVRCHVVAADLSDPTRACDWLMGAEAALGPVDVLVNNAGQQIVGPTEHVAPERGDALLALDLVTPLRLVSAVAPGMLARRAGTIVNIASLAALAPTPGMCHYNAAKAGLGAASESLRGEWRGTGVNVLTVYPGPVRTRMADTAVDAYGTSAARLPIGTTEGLAERVVRAVARRRGRVVYPGIYAVAAWFPRITRLVLDVATPRPRLVDTNAAPAPRQASGGGDPAARAGAEG